jgi:hypothetical protein
MYDDDSYHPGESSGEDSSTDIEPEDIVLNDESSQSSEDDDEDVKIS